MKTMYVYILKCRDNSYYTGVTNNLEKRISQHNDGIDNTCYSYDKLPAQIVYHEIFNDPDRAISFEKKIKGWSRRKKEALIKGDWNKLIEYSKSKGPSTSSG